MNGAFLYPTLPRGTHRLRVRALNDKPPGNTGYVLYWMQHAQRSEDNHALESAVATSNTLGLPVLVVFVVTDAYPEASLRHYRFMAEGLRDVAAALSARGIPFVLKHGSPSETVSRLAEKAAYVICDGAYLGHLREWRGRVARAAPVAVAEVETDIVVPVEVTSNKREYAARTIRKKVMSRIEEFLERPAPLAPSRQPGHIPRWVFDDALDPGDPAALCDTLDIDRSIGEVSWFLEGGGRAAKRRFEEFLADRAHLYEENRNEPAVSDTSYMSPYLHFGHISPIHLVLRMREAAHHDGGIRESLDGFIEQLVVRRELAQNYAYFEPNYESFEALPDWAKTTLGEHASDQRPALYTLDDLSNARTGDKYWNAAMQEMRITGYMHNHMRMYWGKKILEWTADPAEAFSRTLYLNNAFFLDGRDPSSYAGVAWIFGLHDRAWPERAVFGKVRTMKASGLERKCNMPGYLEKVEQLARRAEGRQPERS